MNWMQGWQVAVRGAAKGSILLPLFYVQAAPADVILDTQAVAMILLGGAEQDRQVDTTEPTGTASASVSNSIVTTTANAFVDASNYGALKARGSVSMNKTNNSPYQASALTLLRIQDEWIVGNPLLVGKAGLATITLDIIGEWSVSELWGQAHQRISFDGGGTNLFLHDGSISANFVGPTNENCTGRTGAVDCFGSFTFEVPFVFGSELDIQYVFDASTSITTTASGGFLQVVDASYKMANSVYWGGISSVTVDGVAVSDYVFTSGSGFDWTRSYIPTTSPVPEPGTLALLSVGLAGLAGLRRRKQ